MDKKAKAYIIFDNDGTLVDSEANFIESMEVLLPKYMGRAVSRKEITDCYVPDWFQYLKNLGVDNPTPEFVHSMIDDLTAMNENYLPPLFPGIVELLEALKDLEIATYIWTGRGSKTGLELFKTHGISHFFHDMQFMDTCTPKPHPDGPTKMLGTIDKSKILLIGDSTVDVEGARRFEIPCLIVDWHKKAKSGFFESLGAAAVVTEPRQVLSWVKQNLLANTK